MVEVAIFDFDKTIVSKDSYLFFYIFMYKNKMFGIRHLINSVYYTIALRLKIIDVKKAKEMIYSPLRLKSQAEIDKLSDEFIKEFLTKYTYSQFFEHIKNHKEAGREIIVISASPSFYLKNLVKYIGVSLVLGTSFEVNCSGVYTGLIKGKNCKGDEKVCKLNKSLIASGKTIDWENSYMYSDSLVDKPLFELCKYKYLINNNKHIEDYINLEWC